MEVGAVLQAALSPNSDVRKGAEQMLEEMQQSPQHPVSLFQIIVDNNIDTSVRHVAAIHFKNFVAKNWTQEHSVFDKDFLRIHILLFLPQIPPLLRVQLGECLKRIIHCDYPERCPNLLDWIKHNLQDHHIYAALFVLRILSRKYEFKLYEDRTQLSHIVEETFPLLLNILNGLVHIANPSLEVAELIKLICKIFWSSIYMEIPKVLFDQNVFNGWMMLFLNVLERPVPLEGQPADPELQSSWGWWKVKKWTVHILNRVYSRFGDTRMQNRENKPFTKMFQKHYAGKILEGHLNLLNVIRVGGYLPDKVINLVLQYLSNSISKSSMYSALQPRLDVLLFEIVFPLMCFNDNDQQLWDEDAHEYIRKGYDTIEDQYSPRNASIGFVSELIRKHGKDNLHKFIRFLVENFKRYEEAPVEYKPYRQKDGALLAIGALSDKLKQTEPYKSELEHMLAQHVFPEFSSPVGHLRAKAAWVSGKYAEVSFSDQNNFRKALQCVIRGMRDPELPVRIDSVFALRSFVEACKDLNEIRLILPQLLDDIFKLMNEIENEDLVLTLETIAGKFGEEMAPYALGMCQHLAAAFWRCMNTAETADEVHDEGALAAVGCLRAISTILESVRSLPRLFSQLEPALLPIMRTMLTTDDQEDFEEILQIVSYMTFFSPTISLDMWSLWPLMIEALADWAMVLFPDILCPLDNYISRGTAHFLTCKEPDYQQSLWNMISTVMADKNLEDNDIVPAPKLIEVVFLNCKGQVDQWVEPYLRITVERLYRTKKSHLKCLLMQVIADALYYNAALTLSILLKLGVASEIFNLWFHMLQEGKKSGVRTNFRREHDKKVCCLGLTSLLALPADQLSGEALSRVFRANLDLLVAYKNQVAEAAKEGKNEDGDNMNGDDNGSYKAVEIDAEDGDEAGSSKHRKLSEQEKVFMPNDQDDDDSDDGFSDDEELQSPIDEVDPFVFFVDTMKVMQSTDGPRFQNLTQILEFSIQAIANCVAQHAEIREAEGNIYLRHLLAQWVLVGLMSFEEFAVLKRLSLVH
ncbi:hypothetical protein RJT34_07609 [Clitoria ternatea]|uniref:Importin N-terminal domain-containing protein n=1 Tax=Clitoria ternatea TaxID=43366 RepID=A0AAN9K2S8_CLITE